MSREERFEMWLEFDGDTVRVIHSNCKDRVDRVLEGAEQVQHTYCG